MRSIGIIVDVSNLGIISLTTAQKITKDQISEGLWIYTFLNKLQKLISKDILLKEAIKALGLPENVRKTKKVKQMILQESKNIQFDVFFVREYRGFSNINVRKQIDKDYKQSASRVSLRELFKQKQSSNQLSSILKAYVRKQPKNSWQLNWILVEFLEYLLPVYSFEVNTDKVIEADDLIGSLLILPKNYQTLLSEYDSIYIISRDKDFYYLTSLPNVYQLEPTTDKIIKANNQNNPLVYTILKAIVGDTADNIKSLSTELNEIFRSANIKFQLQNRNKLETTINSIPIQIDFLDFIKFIKGYQFDKSNLSVYLQYLKELSNSVFKKHIRVLNSSLNSYAELELKIQSTITELIVKKLKLILPELIEIEKDFVLKQPNPIVDLNDYFKELKITRLNPEFIKKTIKAKGNAFEVISELLN